MAVRTTRISWPASRLSGSSSATAKWSSGPGAQLTWEALGEVLPVRDEPVSASVTVRVTGPSATVSTSVTLSTPADQQPLERVALPLPVLVTQPPPQVLPLAPCDWVSAIGAV